MMFCSVVVIELNAREGKWYNVLLLHTDTMPKKTSLLLLEVSILMQCLGRIWLASMIIG